jgi:hypothetical protein
MSDPGITEIGLERCLGFGPCPDFRFIADSDGRYAYEGRRHVEPLGERSGRFPPVVFDRLAEVCDALRILELEDRYESHFDDVGLVIVTVRHAAGVKRVISEQGDYKPVRLWAFASLVELAMRETFAAEDRGGTGRRR